MDLRCFLTWANTRLKTVCGRSQEGKGLQCHIMKGIKSLLHVCMEAARRKRVHEESTGKELDGLKSTRGEDGVGS